MCKICNKCGHYICIAKSESYRFTACMMNCRETYKVVAEFDEVNKRWNWLIQVELMR